MKIMNNMNLKKLLIIQEHFIIQKLKNLFLKYQNGQEFVIVKNHKIQIYHMYFVKCVINGFILNVKD